MTPAQELAKLRRLKELEAKSQASGSWVTDEMSGGQRFMAGMGKAFVDISRGAEQLARGAIPGVSDRERQLNEEIALSNERDQPLMQTAGGIGGNIAGNVAAFVPSAFVPGANTYTGAAVAGGVMGALQPVTEDQSRLVNTGMGSAGGVAGQGIGRYIGSKIAGRVAAKTANATKDAVTKTARDAGFVVPPTQTNPTVANRILEGWSGKIQTGQAASIKNQPLINKKALAAIGLPDDAPLTVDTLNVVRKAAGQSYDDLANIGRIQSDRTFLGRIAEITKSYRTIKKDAPKEAIKEVDNFIRDLTSRKEFNMAAWTERLKALRFESKTLFKSDDPSKVALGKIKGKAATAFEDLIERRMMQAGNNDLLKNFREGRQLIAKTYTIEKALNPATGNVNAAKLGNMLKANKKLSDELLDIARVQVAYPKAMQEITSSMPGVSPLDVATAAIGTASATTPKQAVGVLGAVGLRPVARELITSGPYQAMFGNPNYSTGLTLRALNTRPGQAALRLAPSSIGASQQ